jgi:hypothetical protein
MPELSAADRQHILQRFPTIELSYETIPHTKVSTDYNLCMAIPVGTKCYAWMTFYGEDDVCFLLELNKEKKISKISYTLLKPCDILANGTLFYGTLVSPQVFVIEDIFLYRGISAKKMLLSEKLGCIESALTDYTPIDMHFYLPALWGVTKTESYECLYDIPAEFACIYPVHHIQYRCLNTVAPYLNSYPTKKGFTPAPSQNTIIYVPYSHANFAKPQYKGTVVFKVMADIQYDIYRLFAYGSKKTDVYYNVAYIPNYKNSVFMNKIFRNIRENANLDAIEESDDEEDFENIDPEKYVDLKKAVFMECRFNTKFKKWVPVRIAESYQKVVHISNL